MTKWVTKNFDDFFDMLPTNTLSRDKLNDQFGTYQNIHYGDVLIKYPFCLDCSNNEIPYINEGENFNKTELKEGDVVFADTAEDDTVGKCVEVLNIGDRKIVSGLHTYLCRPKLKMAPGYLGYFLNSDAFHNQLLRYIAGSKVSSVNKTSIKNTCIFYPESLAEQRRIAGILSSADGAIAASEALIEKYRNIKRGLLTTLLQPKEGWKKVKFDDFFDFLPTNTLSRDKLNDQRGTYQNIHYGDVLIKYPFCLDCNSNEIPFINEAVNFNKAEIKDGDVVFADTAEDDTVGKCVEILNVGEKKIVAGLHTYLCRPKYKMALGYLGYFLNSDTFHDQLLRYIAGSKVSSVNKTSIKNTYIYYPSDLAEQRRIAEILSSVDAKIAAEEKVVEKYKGVKKGLIEEMMGSGK